VIGRSAPVVDLVLGQLQTHMRQRHYFSTHHLTHRALGHPDSADLVVRQPGPEEWMPAKHRCAYVGEWVAVKICWGLKVDNKGKAALTKTAAVCPNVKMTVKKA
jgi:hypothetical protein